MKFNLHPIEWTPEKISRLWDFISENAALSHRYFGSQVGAHVAAVINRHLKLKNLRTILDLSCGKGDIIASILPYLKHGQSIYGTDFSDRNIKHTDNRFKENPSFQKAHLLRDYPSPFSEGFFNLIIITEVVEHLNDIDLDLLLTEASRLLSSGGTIFVTTPNNEDLDADKVMCPDCGCVYHRWQHVRKWTPESLKQKMEHYSFQTTLVQQIAWGAPFKKRLALKFAVKMNLLIPGGLLYFGKKI